MFNLKQRNLLDRPNLGVSKISGPLDMEPLEPEQARLSGISEPLDNQWPDVVSQECPM